MQTNLPAWGTGLSTEGHSKRQSPETFGSTLEIRELDPRDTRSGPPMYEDWNPNIRELNPRCMETGPPMHQATGPSIPQTRTSSDRGLRGIQDFVGFRTSWDSGLCGIQDFVGPRTSWDLGLHRKQDLYTPRIGILFCGIL